MRDMIILGCSSCKQRNYTTTKNKKTTTNKLSFRKYCRFCKIHTDHKEVK